MPLRALGGVLSLVGRDTAAKLLAFAGWIILARLLDPATFGLFAIAAFVLSVFALFSQLGFGAAVVRDHQSIPRARLDALFTLQLAVVTALSMLLLALAPVVSLLTGDPGTGWLVASLSGALLLLSLRSLPSAMQERALAYGAPVLADLVSQVSYWLIALPLAWLGWGVWSVVWSVLLSSALGTLVLLVKTRWRPRLNFDWRGLRGDTVFGLMYASQALSHSLKYAILPGLGSALYGGIVVGYLTWAHQIAALPNQFSQLVSRVNYPALSHLQDHRDKFARLAANSLAWTCRLLFPAFAVLIGLAPQITEYVYGAKWLPAVHTLVILSLSMVASCVAGVLLPALYSLGRERTGTAIALGWPALTWLVAGILAVTGLDFNSIAWAYLAASVLALIATLYALRDLGLTRLLGPLPLPALSSTAIGLACWLVAPGLVHNLLSLIALAAVGGLLALGISLWPARAQAFRLLKALTEGRRDVIRDDRRHRHITYHEHDV